MLIYVLITHILDLRRNSEADLEPFSLAAVVAPRTREIMKRF